MKRMTIHGNFIRLVVIATIGVLILTLVPSLSLHKTTQATPAAISTPATTRIIELYGALPLRFEANQGQTDSQVRYLSRNPGYDLFLAPCESVMVLHRHQRAQTSGSTMSEPAKTDKAHARNIVRMRLIDANPEPAITGRDKLPGRSHYFIGNDRKHWHTDIPQYARVAYEGIYPGIDLAFYGTNRQMEYDFVVKPGADPKNIIIAFSGMDTIALEKNGDLILRMGNDTIVHHAPKIYQEINGEKRSIKGHYVLYDGNRAGFHVAHYDTKRPLVIDPELTYSTYLGGGFSDSGYSIAIDSSGNAYITGTTSSGNFPTTLNPYQDTNKGNFDAFVVKINPSGSALLFSTYIGGSNTDEGYGIAVDSSDNVYVTGSTVSSDFPTQIAIQGTNSGGSDAFISKLNSAGSTLEYSTYHGGFSFEAGYGIAVDSSGNAYVTGRTDSNNFPTAGAPAQDTWGGGQDAFVTKVNAGGTALTYSTYLGGRFDDYGQSITVDSSGNAYVTGRTTSDNYPTQNPYQTYVVGSGSNTFVTKLNAGGTTFTYSTYLGGTNDDYGQSIAVDTSGNAYVTGGTYSSDFPTQGTPIQSTNAGGLDVFVTKFNSSGSSLTYSTYLGGTGTDEGYSIAVDGNNYAYVTGRTSSSDLSTTANAVQTTRGGDYDAFIAKLNTSGSSLLYSTYLGGGSLEYGQSIAVDSSENVYVTGYTDSSNFPTEAPYQSLSGGSRDAFVTKSTTTDAPTPTPPPSDSGDNCFVNSVFHW